MFPMFFSRVCEQLEICIVKSENMKREVVTGSRQSLTRIAYHITQASHSKNATK